MIFRRVTLQTSSKTTFAKNAHTFAKTFYSIIYATTILFSKYIFHHNFMELDVLHHFWLGYQFPIKRITNI